MKPTRDDSPLAIIALAAVPALCCGTAALAAAVAGAGITAWIGLGASLVAIPVVVGAVGLQWFLWGRSRF